MAKKHTYTVQTPTGPVTRTTARTYTHIIIAKANEKYELAQATSPKNAENDLAHWVYENETASGNCHGLFDDKRGYGFGPGREEEFAAYNTNAKAKHIEKAQAWILANPTPEGFVAKRLAERMAYFNERKARGAFDNFGDICWCGREDLAHKELAKHQGYSYLTEVAILEVPQV